jgi:hypothetical protein
VKKAKTSDQVPARSTTATPIVQASARERKPWKKRTPAEVVLAQIDRVRDDVERKQEEFNEAKRQLDKLEAARKLLEEP